MRRSDPAGLGDRPIAADASAKVFDRLGKQVTGLNDRRKLKLLFTNVEDRVRERLLLCIDVEFRALPENECAAAVEAARETLGGAAQTDDDLFASSRVRISPAPRHFLRAAARAMS